MCGNAEGYFTVGLISTRKGDCLSAGKLSRYSHPGQLSLAIQQEHYALAYKLMSG